jgi:hypothetical protein
MGNARRRRAIGFQLVPSDSVVARNNKGVLEKFDYQ